YKHPQIEMSTIFGDGSGQDSGFMGKLLGAGKRVLTGESMFMTVFTHTGSGKARVAFGAPYPGTILAIDLDSVGGTLICQKDAFLAAAKGVSIGIAFQKKIIRRQTASASAGGSRGGISISRKASTSLLNLSAPSTPPSG
ncbi:MAG: AIM24 family protein, partial [Chloroflexi bacterium]|nr:AIM24 family protein [Chloroflexota bacterium]